MIRTLRILACTLGLAALAGTAWGQECPSRQECVPGQVQQRTTTTSRGQQNVSRPAQPACPAAPCTGIPMSELVSFFQMVEALGPCAVAQACPSGSCGIFMGCQKAGQCQGTAECDSPLVRKVLAEMAVELLQVGRILHHQGRYAEVEELARKALALDPNSPIARAVLARACRHTGHSAEQCVKDCTEECEPKASCSKPCCGKCERSKSECACSTKCCDDCCGKAKTSACACKDKCCCAKDGGNCACGESCKCKPSVKTSRRTARVQSISVTIICPGHGPAFTSMPMCAPMPFGPASVLAGVVPPCPTWVPGMNCTGGPFNFPVPPPAAARMANILPMPHSVPAMPVSTGCGGSICSGRVSMTPVIASPNCIGPVPMCVPNAVIGKPMKPVKVTANGNRIQISSACLDVQCDRIAIVEDNKVLAEGNVSVAFHVPGRPGSILAERILVGLADGSYEVNPQTGAANVIRTAKPNRDVNATGSCVQPETISTPTSCPRACPYTGCPGQ